MASIPSNSIENKNPSLVLVGIDAQNIDMQQSHAEPGMDRYKMDNSSITIAPWQDGRNKLSLSKTLGKPNNNHRRRVTQRIHLARHQEGKEHNEGSLTGRHLLWDDRQFSKLPYYNNCYWRQGDDRSSISRRKSRRNTFGHCQSKSLECTQGKSRGRASYSRDSEMYFDAIPMIQPCKVFNMQELPQQVTSPPSHTKKPASRYYSQNSRRQPNNARTNKRHLVQSINFNELKRIMFAEHKPSVNMYTELCNKLISKCNNHEPQKERQKTASSNIKNTGETNFIKKESELEAQRIKSPLLSSRQHIGFSRSVNLRMTMKSNKHQRLSPSRMTDSPKLLRNSQFEPTPEPAAAAHKSKQLQRPRSQTNASPNVLARPLNLSYV